MKTKQPVITILIRTSNRPKSFERCIRSVQNEARRSLSHINVIVAADNDESLQYAQGALATDEQIRLIRTERSKDPNDVGYYNLYLNDLVLMVDRGWFFILDDDDTIAPGALKYLSNFLEEAENKKREVVFVRMRWPNGRLIPEDTYFTREPQRKHIGMPCMVIHASVKDQVVFDGQKAADYRLAQKLWNSPVKKAFADMVLVDVGNTGNGGAAIDI